MSGKFFSRKNPRADWWDYSKPGNYFITICTKNKEHFFGSVDNNKMILSKLGTLAHEEWFEIPIHSPSIILLEFQVMPNHIHGILELLPIMNKSMLQLSSQQNMNYSIQPYSIHFEKSNYLNKSSSLSTIIGNYKSAVTRKANEMKLPFEWQGRFHDRIIRNQDEFKLIANYIRNNPRNWKDDRFY